ncbi:MAG: flagellar motor switch protein FliN [Myxococcota bacterium]
MANETDSLAPVPSEGLSPVPPSPLGAFGMLRDVEVEVTLEIGRRRMKIADILHLQTGETVELDKAAGDPIDIYVNGQLLGRGEAVVVGDRYGVRLTELVTPASDGGISR